MELTKASILTNETTQALGAGKPGEVFRFAFLSFTDAIKEEAFYVVLRSPENKGVKIANLKDGTVLIRDPDHRVVVHLTTLQIIE